MSRWYEGYGAAMEIIRHEQIVRPRDMLEMNTSPTWLYFLDGMELKRVGPGLYTVPQFTPDPAHLVARKYPRLTFGALSALWVHGLIPRPEHDWWIIGVHSRVPSFAPGQTRFLRSSWPAEDREEALLPPRNFKVFAQTVTRAVLDCIRHRKKLGAAAVDSALSTVFEQPFDRDALEERARQLHVITPLRAWFARRTH